MTSTEPTHAWTNSSGGVDWRVELPTDRLLPGRLVPARVTVTARNAIGARGLLVTLKGEEHWQYDVTTSDSKGHMRTETRTGRAELPMVPVQVSGPLTLATGETRTFDVDVPVPALGPASLEATVAGAAWTIEAKLDIESGRNSSIDVPVVVLQPTALLRAGVVRVAQFSLFDAADAAAGDITGQMELDPAPLVTGMPFKARVAVHSPSRIDLQEIRAEIRVKVEATMSSGKEETITAWAGRVSGAGSLHGDQTIEFQGELGPTPLPTVVLPHGKTSAEFHVILARAWKRDPHLVRDVAIATTAEV